MAADLKMEVYTPALELISFLEIQKSVIWSEKAFSTGKFSVESLITTESMTMLQPENIIWIEGETAGIIETVLEESGQNGPYITASGPTLTGILDRRVLWGLYNLKGTVPEIMHTLVNDCCINPTRGDVESRKIPGLVLLDAPAGGDVIQFQTTGGTLLERLETLGETYGVAFGVRFNPAVPQMEFWTRWGQDRSIHQSENNPVLYSTELDDVLSSEYTYNSQDYRNVALVAGEGEGSERVYVTVENEVEDDTDTPAVTPPSEPGVTKYTVTLLVDPEGGGTASGSKTVAAGVSITVTATPSENFTFVEWRENGVRVSGDRQYTFTVTADRTLTAVFAVTVKTYTITATVDPSGSGNVTGSGRHQEGATVNLKATENEGYSFNQWRENGQPVYAYNEDGYYINSSGSPIILQSVTGENLYVSAVDGPTASQLQNLTNNGFTFASWMAQNGYDVSGNAEYSFPALMDRDLVAAFEEVPSSRLPAGYTEIEYIESSGKQFTDTGIVPTSTTKIEIDVEPAKDGASPSTYFFGSTYGGNATTKYAFYAQWYTTGIRCALGAYSTISATVISSDKTKRRVFIQMDASTKTASVDGSSKTFSNNSFGNVMGSIALLAPNVSTSASSTNIISAKLYSCRIYVNDTPVRDFVPCINPSNEVGLYDLVGGAFYGNIGTGTFTAGPAV